MASKRDTTFRIKYIHSHADREAVGSTPLTCSYNPQGSYTRAHRDSEFAIICVNCQKPAYKPQLHLQHHPRAFSKRDKPRQSPLKSSLAFPRLLFHNKDVTYCTKQLSICCFWLVGWFWAFWPLNEAKTRWFGKKKSYFKLHHL